MDEAVRLNFGFYQLLEGNCHSLFGENHSLSEEILERTQDLGKHDDFSQNLGFFTLATAAVNEEFVGDFKQLYMWQN